VITGQLDLRSADQLIDALDEACTTNPPPPLILDLAALTSWHSSAVAALLTAQQRINAHPSAQMILGGLPRPLLQRLYDTGLAGRFTIADTTDNAIGKITPLRDPEPRVIARVKRGLAGPRAHLWFRMHCFSAAAAALASRWWISIPAGRTAAHSGTPREQASRGRTARAEMEPACHCADRNASMALDALYFTALPAFLTVPLPRDVTARAADA